MSAFVVTIKVTAKRLGHKEVFSRESGAYVIRGDREIPDEQSVVDGIIGALDEAIKGVLEPYDEARDTITPK